MSPHRMNDETVQITEVNHLIFARNIARKIGLVETIDRMVPSEMAVSPGRILLGLVLDALSGRTPLFRLKSQYEGQDTELLLGEGVSAEDFADHNIGRVLDKTFLAGTMAIFTQLAHNALVVYDIDARHVHYDATSISVFGDYDLIDPPFLITYGHSKDKRSDLKQFLVGMLCVDRDIPIWGKTMDGNASEKDINNSLLSEVSRYMARHGVAADEFIYIADAAMTTRKNLGKCTEGDGVRFLSRFPANFRECSRVIREAVEADRWIDIGPLAQTPATLKRPAAHYRAHESSVFIEGNRFRVVVVHSTAYDKRRRKRIERQLSEDRKDLKNISKKYFEKVFHCRADAEAAAARLAGMGRYHRVESEVVEKPRFAPGRPPKDRPRMPERMEYTLIPRIVENPEKVEALHIQAGCFVLISNVEESDGRYSAKELLQLYKEQNGIEKNFGFIKDPAIINAIFLKKAERIEVLGLILLIALLIWRLIERILRHHIEQTGKPLPGWDGKKTMRPTAFMMTTKFKRILVVTFGGKRKLLRPLNSEQLAWIKALGLTPDAFTAP